MKVVIVSMMSSNVVEMEVLAFSVHVADFWSRVFQEQILII
jgi:hypothetical protein